MAALSDYLENALLQEIFNNTDYTAPATYVSLYTSSPADDDSGDEVANAGAYARKLVNPAAGGDPEWLDAATDGVGKMVENQHDIIFTTATAAWGTITHFGIHDSGTWGAGNLLYHGALDASKVVGDGDTFKFAAGNLELRLE